MDYERFDPRAATEINFYINVLKVFLQIPMLLLR